MSFWLINPKNEGSETDLSNESCDCVFMGWDKEDCPKFYNDVRNGDIIIIAEKAHSNSKVHFIGIADELDEQNQCWKTYFEIQVKPGTKLRDNLDGLSFEGFTLDEEASTLDAIISEEAQEELFTLCYNRA